MLIRYPASSNKSTKNKKQINLGSSSPYQYSPIYLVGSYCSLPTCSIHSTTLPFRFSWMAIWDMPLLAVAPCQCFSLGANQMTSPGCTSSLAPPSRCTQPQPAVMISVCPSGCVCQAVLAPGSKVTQAEAPLRASL